MRSVSRLKCKPVSVIPAARATRCHVSEFGRTVDENPLMLPGLPGGFGRCGGPELRFHRTLSLFAASLIALAPVSAMAQTQTQTQAQTDAAATAPQEVSRVQPVTVRDRPRPEYDAPGRRLGAFNLSASLDFDVTSTDNLFAAPDGFEFDDTIYEVTPTARLESDWSRHMLAVEASYTSRTHEDFSNEDADTHYLRGSGRLDIGDSSAINAAARVAHQVTPRTDPDSPLVGAPVEYDRVDATVGVQHRFARFLLRLDGTRSEYDYEGAQDFRDNEENTLRGRVEVDMWPRVGLLLTATADDRSYDNSPNLSSEGFAYLVGAKIDADLVQGEVSIGHFQRDYDDPTVGTFEGLAISAAIDWLASQLTTVTLSARRNADDQISANVGQPYITTEFGARVDHELRRNVILTGGVLFGERDYESIDRNDEYTEISVGADWIVNPHAVVRFRYEHDETDSSGALPYRDYEVNDVSLGLSLRL